MQRLVDMAVYDAMQEKLRLLGDVQTAMAQLDAGEGLAHDDAKRLVADLRESLQEPGTIYRR
jgi:hypothetical protein